MAGSWTTELGGMPSHANLASWVVKKPLEDEAAVGQSPQKRIASTASTALTPETIVRPVTMASAANSINKISPNKRKLVEEIDSEDDDEEFQENTKQRNRRVTRKKQNAKVSRNATSSVGKGQAMITAFCIRAKETVQSKAQLQEQPIEPVRRENEVTKEEEEEENTKQSPPNDANVTSNHDATEEEAIEHQQTPEMNETSGSGNNESVSLVVEKDESVDVDVITTETSADNDDAVIPPEQNDAVIHLEQDSAVLLMSSGRPKRQAVLRAERMRNREAEEESFASPPPRVASRSYSNKNLSNLSGVKRKLSTIKSKERKKTTVQESDEDVVEVVHAKAKQHKAATFFLTGAEKKQLQEIEILSSFREELRKKREKDLAFFGDREVQNPFFQSRPEKKQSEKDDVVVLCLDPDSDKKKLSRLWEKQLPVFPPMQHVLRMDLDDEEEEIPPSTLCRRQSAPFIHVIDDHEDGWNQFLSASATAFQDHTSTEWFWLRQRAELETTEDTLCTSAFTTDADLMAAIADCFAIKESRVIKTLETLRQAREKRRTREANLSLVDRYLPVSSRGLISKPNKHPMHFLLSWLNAWKTGGDEEGRRSCFQSDLLVFEDDESDDDDVENLCRLFVVQGDSGAGKSAAVYACAEELGYNVIEINAAQQRSGRHVMELAGEATQSIRVLHNQTPALDKKSTTKKKKKPKSTLGRRTNGDPTRSHLSLVLFEDIDLVFDDDKGFINTVCSIAKTTKCPVVLTCQELPHDFPSAPKHLAITLHKPSPTDFSVWMLLVAYLEDIVLSASMAQQLATAFHCDIRRSLHFLQTHRHALATSAASVERPIPMWAKWPSLDFFTSNFLPTAAASSASFAVEKHEEHARKERVVTQLKSLSDVLDTVSLGSLWTPSMADDEFFHRPTIESSELELRMAAMSLATAFTASPSPPSDQLRRLMATSAVEKQHTQRRQIMNRIAPKLKLAATAPGTSNGNALALRLDYVPLLQQMLQASDSSQDTTMRRRRCSRRNHYLSDVLMDMTVMDDMAELHQHLVE